MKNCILFLFIIFSSYCYSQDTIIWKSCYKLKWTDFHGLADTSSNYEAITSSGIEYKYSFSDSTFEFSVFAFFDKVNSWKGSSANSETLRHEQLHFDITEVFARKLRKEFSNLKPERNTLKQKIKEMVQNVNNIKEQMQDQYDLETDFGRNKEMQEKWETKVSNILKER